MRRLVVLVSLHLTEISMSTNNECLISAIHKDGNTMLLNWQARISEVTKHRKDLAKDGPKVEEVSHV